MATVVLETFLQSPRLGQQEKSSAIPGISRSDIYEVEVAVPPVAEQQRIVAKLEKLLSQVDACQQQLAKIPVLLKRFRQSVLAAACSGRLTADWRAKFSETISDRLTDSVNDHLPPIADEELIIDDIPSTWQLCRLGSLAMFINGDRGKNYPNRKEYVAAGIPFINTGHIRPDGTLSSESMHYLTRKKFDSLRSGKVKKGDLVYCLRGATLGKTAVVSYEEGAIASSLVIIRPTQDLDERYAYYFLVSPYGIELKDRFDNGSAQPNLGAESVKLYALPLPPVAEQQEIVRRVEKLFTLADQIEARFAEGQKRVDGITQSLLAKAFRGELVPTEYELAKAEGRSFEPAEELLERIRSNGGEPAKKKGKLSHKASSRTL